MCAGTEFELFADCRCKIAESPLWNDADQMLYWRGSEGELYRKSLYSDSNDFECFRLEIGNIGSMVFTHQNTLLLFAQHGRVWRWTPKTEPVLIAEIPGATDGFLFNDVIADPQGRIFCGALADNYFEPEKRARHGKLWCLDIDRTFYQLESSTGRVPNGMRFSPDLKYFYFTISDEQTIYRYDYNIKTGCLSNRESFIKGDSPDGLAIDEKGCLWSANWSGSLTRYSPAGEILKEYRFPEKTISSISFGGPENLIIFITTANYPKPMNPESNCTDGGVFILKQNIHGMPDFPATDFQYT